MSFRTGVYFNGIDTSSEPGLWVTDGTTLGTVEIAADINPQYITSFNGEIIFEAQDSSSQGPGLWISNGTTAGTVELGGNGSTGITNANPQGLGPGYFIVYGNEVLFRGETGVGGDQVPGLWVTNGTATGTFELGGTANDGINNVSPGGLIPGDPDFTLFDGVVLFSGRDAANNQGLWETNGTAQGTFELAPISGAFAVGSPGSDVLGALGNMTVLNSALVLFRGNDLKDTEGSLWETNGTAAGTFEIGGQANAQIAEAPSGFSNQFVSVGPIGMVPTDITAFNGQALFTAFDNTLTAGANGYNDTDALWISNGTVAGTIEIGGAGNAQIQNANSAANGGIFWYGNIEFPDFTVYNNKVLFVGYDKDNHAGLWITDGTATGTTEIGGLGNAGIGGGGLTLDDSESPDFTLYKGEVLFSGIDSSNRQALWVTDGTAAGTHEITGINGAAGDFIPTYLDFAMGQAPTLSVTSVTNATRGQALSLSRLVTISDPESTGYETLQLWDSDGTVADGQFLINGAAQTGAHAINVPSGANVVFEPGTAGGTDTLWAQLIEDNGVASGWKEFTVTVPLPGVMVTSDNSAANGQHIALSNLVTISNPGNVSYQTLQLWDSYGTAAGGEFLINGAAQTGGHAINVPSGANVVFDPGTSAGTDTLWAQLIESNGSGSGWKEFTVTVPLPSPVVTSDNTAAKGQDIALSNLVTISNPGNVGYQTLQLWDSDGTTVGGEFLINGVAQTAGHAISVPSGANVVFDVGTSAGTDTLWAQLVQANGTVSGWKEFTVTVPLPSPVVISDNTAAKGQQIALSNLVTISNPGNVGYQTLQLWDSDGTTVGGEFLINGVAQTAGHAINVPSGANVVFDAGTSAGTDTLWAQIVQANGTVSGWKEFTVKVPLPSLIVTSDNTAAKSQHIALSSLVTISNPGNISYQTLQLWDSDGTTAGGEFLINGVAQTAGHAINVPSGANVVFEAGTSVGTDTLWAQLIQSNGTAGGWDKFTVSVPNPTLAVHNDTTATPSQTIALSNLVTISDPGNVGYQKLELWDSNGTAATGQFKVGGVAQTGGQEIDVSPANVAGVVFDEGSTGNTDTLWARLMLNDGITAAWQQFTVVDPLDVAAGGTLELPSAYAGTVNFEGSTGTLQLDNSASFSGTVAGMSGADTIDFRDIGFNPNPTLGSTLGYNANATNTGGSLSISDGTHLVQISLLGQYSASSFATASDGHGGTSIELQTTPLPVLAQSQHA